MRIQLPFVVSCRLSRAAAGTARPRARPRSRRRSARGSSRGTRPVARSASRSSSTSSGAAMNVETSLEPEPPPDGVGRACCEQHVQRDRRAHPTPAPARRTRGAAASRLLACARAGGHRRGARASRRASARRCLRDPDRAFTVNREEHAARRDLPDRVGPFVVPRLRLEARRLGHLVLELLPELAQDRLVRLRRAADRYGFVSHPVRR